MKNFYSSCGFERTKMLRFRQKSMMLAIFLLMSVSSVFADQVLPVYHSPYHFSHLYKTDIYSVKKKNLPVFTGQPLPVYRSPHRTAREYPSPTFSVTVQDNYSSSYNYSSTSGFTIIDYTQRKPFEETDISMLSSQNRPMRAPAEDDPPFPGDPGQMPVGDGLGFLLVAAAGYALMKRKSFYK